MKKIEEDWRHKLNVNEHFDNCLDTSTKAKLWLKMGQAKFSYEENWEHKYNQTKDLNGFLEDPVKVRMEGEVVAGLHDFEANWRDNIDEFSVEEGILGDAGKNKIWAIIQATQQSGISEEAPKKTKKLFAFQWSHAAAVMIGILGTWVFWNISSNTKDTLAVKFQSIQNTLINKAEVNTKTNNNIDLDTTIEEQKEADLQSNTQVAIANIKSENKQSNRKVVETISFEHKAVVPIETPKINVKDSEILIAKTENQYKEVDPVTNKDEQEIMNEKIIASNKSPNKKVVFIADVKPKEDASKTNGVYSRAFGNNNSKENVQNTNSPVFKKYIF